MKKPYLKSLVESIVSEIGFGGGSPGLGYSKSGAPGADGYGSYDSKVDNIDGDTSGTADGGIAAMEEAEAAKIKAEQAVADKYATALFKKLKASVKKITSKDVITTIRVAYEHAEDIGYDKGYAAAEEKFNKGTRLSLPKDAKKITLPTKPTT